MLLGLAAGGTEVDMAALLASGALLACGCEEMAYLTDVVLATTFASTTVAFSSSGLLMGNLRRWMLLDLLHSCL